MAMRSSPRHIVRQALALLAVAVLLPATPGRAALVGALDAADEAAAIELEAKIEDNFYQGQIYEVDYRTADRIPGDITNVGAFGDSALWTGTYLSAQSFRYALAKIKLAGGASGDDAVFWQRQKSQAKSRIDEMVAKYHMLINISRNWNHDFGPSVNPGDPAHPASFGGGVVRGEAGYLFRACVRESFQWRPGPNGVTFKLYWDEGPDAGWYYCEDGTSRDAYAGTTFGLLNAFDLVGADDPSMRAQIRDDVIRMTAFALKYGWTTPRPHGNVSLPPLGHDFHNFISPLFVYVPLARLNMTQAARHVSHSAGTPEQSDYWERIWTEELASQGPILAASMEVDAVQPNDSYYKYNLHHLTGYSVTRLEPNAAVRGLIKQALGVMDRTTGDEINAHFETITYTLTGETSRRDAAIEHLREWRDYRARVDRGGPTGNEAKCGVSFECVPQDQLETIVSTPSGDQTIVVAGTSSKLRARRPLPIADRPQTDFLWQRPPTQLETWTSTTHQAPGSDYLLPYWMLRYYTEGVVPALDPFPAYVGPAHA
ncbi:MAG: hypothetical protein WDA27_05420 [Actinomycetota bacterium]